MTKGLIMKLHLRKPMCLFNSQKPSSPAHESSFAIQNIIVWAPYATDIGAREGTEVKTLVWNVWLTLV